MTGILEILAEHKNLIAPILLQGGRKDKKYLQRLARYADIVQIVLPESAAIGLDRQYFLKEYPEFSLPAVLETCTQFHQKSSKKIILLSGVQQAYAYGLSEFFADFIQAGVEAFMFSDLAPEESAEFLALAEQYQVPLIFQAMQSAPESRIMELLQISPQVVTLVTAVLGQEDMETDHLLDMLNRLKKRNVPVVLIDHVLKQEDNLWRVYQAADGVILSGLEDMPNKEALRTLKRIKKFLAVLAKRMVK